MKNDVTLQHGQKALGIGRIAGLDDNVEDQAAATSRQIDLMTILHRAAALTRLAWSMKDLQDIMHELKGKGLALRATEQPVGYSIAAGKVFLDMLGVFAEFETDLPRERQLASIKAAKARSIYKGRP